MGKLTQSDTSSVGIIEETSKRQPTYLMGLKTGNLSGNSRFQGGSKLNQERSTSVRLAIPVKGPQKRSSSYLSNELGKFRRSYQLGMSLSKGTSEMEVSQQMELLMEGNSEVFKNNGDHARLEEFSQGMSMLKEEGSLENIELECYSDSDMDPEELFQETFDNKINANGLGFGSQSSLEEFDPSARILETEFQNPNSKVQQPLKPSPNTFHSTELLEIDAIVKENVDYFDDVQLYTDLIERLNGLQVYNDPDFTTKYYNNKRKLQKGKYFEEEKSFESNKDEFSSDNNELIGKRKFNFNLSDSGIYISKKKRKKRKKLKFNHRSEIRIPRKEQLFDPS